MKFITQATLTKLTSLATIISLIAVPIVIAILGSKIQSSISNEDIKKDYVSMAIQILAQEPKNGDQEDLRKWAIDILAKNSPVPFTSALKTQLKAKPWLMGAQQFIIDSKQYVPPEELMKEPLLLEKNKSNLDENFKRSEENAIRLKELQVWINKKRQEEIARNKFFFDLNKKVNE